MQVLTLAEERELPVCPAWIPALFIPNLLSDLERVQKQLLCTDVIAGS